MANRKMVDQLLNRMMLGEKIKLAECLLDPKIIKQLQQLNKKRIILAHNVTGEKVFSEDGSILKTALKTGELIFIQGRKEIPFNKTFLTDITELAKELSETLLVVLRQSIKEKYI